MLDNEQLFNDRERHHNRTQTLRRLAEFQLRSRVILDPPIQLESPLLLAPKQVRLPQPEAQQSRRRQQWTFLFSMSVTRSNSSRSSRKRESAFQSSFTLTQPSFSFYLPRRAAKQDTLKTHRTASKSKCSLTSSTAPASKAPPVKSSPLPNKVVEKQPKVEAKPAFPAQAEAKTVENKPALTRTSTVKQTAKTKPASSHSSPTKVAQPKPPSEHQSYPALSSKTGVACPLCRTSTVASRWRGKEKRLGWIGISARRCPRCLHRFYAEPRILRPARKLIAWTLHKNRPEKARVKQKRN